MADALGGKTVKWEEALPIAEEAQEKILSALTGGGYEVGRISVAGSFLRRDPECRDIDIVFEITNTPSGKPDERFDQTPAGFRSALLKLLGECKSLIEPIFEKPITTGLATHGLLHGVQVDVFLAIPGNWATSLCIWAGDRVFNMHKFSKASASGITLWPWAAIDSKTKEVIVFPEMNDLLRRINIEETDVSKWSWRRHEIKRAAAAKHRQAADNKGSDKDEDGNGS